MDHVFNTIFLIRLVEHCLRRPTRDRKKVICFFWTFLRRIFASNEDIFLSSLFSPFRWRVETWFVVEECLRRCAVEPRIACLMSNFPHARSDSSCQIWTFKNVRANDDLIANSPNGRVESPFTMKFQKMKRHKLAKTRMERNGKWHRTTRHAVMHIKNSTHTIDHVRTSGRVVHVVLASSASIRSHQCRSKLIIMDMYVCVNSTHLNKI